MNEQMIRKNNMRIFPIYKMFAWDLLFHYAIIFLFLTQVKGFTASQILLADSFYAIFRVAFQIPCVNITDLFGKQKSLLIGNLLVTLSILMIIIGNGFPLLILFNLVQAIGYNLKGLCEPTILSDSVPDSSSSSKIYAKINGKGSSLYYIFDAISSATTGFLYVISPYFPMILCFLCCVASTIISFWGTLRSSILVDIGVPEQYFGIILAVMQIISSISSRKQQWFHNKLKNRALTWFSLSLSIAFILTGLLVTCNISFSVSFAITALTIALVGIIKGPYYTLSEKYFNSFSNPEVNTKIFAVKSLLENLGRVILSFFASCLLDITTTSYAFIIIGGIAFIVFIFLLNYMKSKVGLKPEEYPEEDLIFSNEK